MTKRYTGMLSSHDCVYWNFTRLICVLPDAQLSLIQLYINYGWYKPLLHAADHPYRRLSSDIIIRLQHFFIQSSAILIFSWLQLDQETSHFIKYALLILRTYSDMGRSVEQWEVHRQNQDTAGNTETASRETEGNFSQNGNFIQTRIYVNRTLRE
jgi:hypothetical protein